ncbi:protein MpATXR6 [Marchantia polymorpha subsp. ruderalis]|uniref:SET domain-containing protein n=1 Tax=Marchantia polymorpha subsp. ruderalis TaxID=1480154 RepID=A0AAF6BKI8_MARPO|nr:hypothetical protein Mp_5g20830 [Marchantia polymorpha subsp. ruderalis]
MSEMIRKITCSPASSSTGKTNLDRVYRGMRELEYSPTEIRKFSESFSKVGLVAVHLSSYDRWEKLRMRISPDLALNRSELEEAELRASNATTTEEISLVDLTVGTCYPGRAVCGTLCVEPFSSVKIFTTSKASATVINSLLEDKFGRVVRVMINIGTPDTFTNSAQIARAASLYQRGSLIDVHSPVLKRCGWDKGLVMYVDNPEKVHLVTDRRLPASLTSKTADHKLNEAIALFNAMDWFKAAQVYTQCIGRCGQQREIWRSPGEIHSGQAVQAPAEDVLWLAYSGRCATWLQLKNYTKALADANKALELECKLKNHSVEDCISKIHFMKGTALFGLERFQEAAQVFQIALLFNPRDKSVQRALERSKLCHELESVLPSVANIQLSSEDFQSARQQCHNGDLDLSEYFLSGESVSPPISSCYVGPVEIQTREGAGRGLFLTESVVAGQLLLVSQALAFVTNKPKSISSYKSVLTIIGQDLESSARREMTLDIQEDLVTQLACNMLSTTRVLPQVYSLSDGRSDQSKIIPNMNIFFPDPPFCDETADGSNDELSDLDNVNIRILREIVAENAICDSDREGNGRSWGVWSLPSFINHSCHPNSHKIRIGDYLLIFASRDMCVGTEITLPYFDVFQCAEGRLEECVTLGFVCRCRRCLFEQILPCCFSNLQRKVVELLEITILEDDDLSPSSLDKPPSLLRLARLAEALEQEMASNQFTEEARNWIRASIVDPYLACSRLSNDDLRELHPSSPGIRRADRMALLVDAFTAVNAGHELGRRFSAHLLHEVGHEFGWGSPEHVKQEVRVMKIFRAYYGITDPGILRQLIAKVRQDL